MIKWNCCKIHGPTCWYWITCIIGYTTICPTRQHCITGRNSICWVWACWAYRYWPNALTRYKISSLSSSLMLEIIFAWNSCCYSTRVSVRTLFILHYAYASSWSLNLSLTVWCDYCRLHRCARNQQQKNRDGRIRKCAGSSAWLYTHVLSIGWCEYLLSFISLLYTH